jgi:hypothetical protein
MRFGACSSWTLPPPATPEAVAEAEEVIESVAWPPPGRSMAGSVPEAQTLETALPVALSQGRQPEDGP